MLLIYMPLIRFSFKYNDIVEYIVLLRNRKYGFIVCDKCYR